MPRGRPPSLDWPWTVTVLLLLAALISFWQNKILGSFIVNFSVSAFAVSLVYIIFKKNLAGLPGWRWGLIGLGLVMFVWGSPVATAINGFASKVSGGTFALIPMDTASATIFSVFPLILVVLLVVVYMDRPQGAPI